MSLPQVATRAEWLVAEKGTAGHREGTDKTTGCAQRGSAATCRWSRSRRTTALTARTGRLA